MFHGFVHGRHDRSFGAHGFGGGLLPQPETAPAKRLMATTSSTSALTTCSTFQIVFTGSMVRAFLDDPNNGSRYDARMPRPPRSANDPRVRPSTWRKTLRAEDLVDELAAKRAEDRIVGEVPGRAQGAVRSMLRGLRRRLFG